jgi:hypothetical protein
MIADWGIADHWAVALRYFDQESGRVVGGYIRHFEYDGDQFEHRLSLLLSGIGAVLEGDPNFMWQHHRTRNVSAVLTGMNNTTPGSRILKLLNYVFRISRLELGRLDYKLGSDPFHRAIKFDVAGGKLHLHQTLDRHIVGSVRKRAGVLGVTKFPVIEKMAETETLDMNIA